MRSTASTVAEHTRRFSAACGVVALLAIGLTGDGVGSDRFALVALVAIAAAVAIGWAEILALREPSTDLNGDRSLMQNGRVWALAAAAVVITCGLMAQSWFRPGTTIATGDFAPPVGTAWIQRLFEPWIWAGPNLGGPSPLPEQLPWAAVVRIIAIFGGDSILAQRAWYTILFIGAGLAAFALLAAFRLSLAAALGGTAVFVLNPYVVSVVGANPVYLGAMCLLASMPAVLVAVGARRLSVPLGAVLIAAAAPVFGYVYSNPPLVGMTLGLMALTPLITGLVDGRRSAVRSLQALVLALPILVAASLYWIVPAINSLPSGGNSQLSNLASWAWTERRATVTNGFWLNTTWAWSFPEYIPFAWAYEAIPLSFIRFCLPALAFGALALGSLREYQARRIGLSNRTKRLAIVAATGAFVVVFLSTGTNEPGNVVFDKLYRLPLGWLLREPGRFLMLACLAYAVLVAIVLDASHAGQIFHNLTARWFTFARRPELWGGSAVIGMMLCLGFPLFTGVEVPDSRPILPPAHVKVPTYWSQMAHLVDGLNRQGALLVMPPDDFYQMPYSWGYYGSDSFLVDMFRRPILVPNGQGYAPASIQVQNAVNQTAESILQGDWQETRALLSALDAPLVIVRRDIDSSYTGRRIISPSDLTRSLRAAPIFELVAQIGQLDLYALRETTAEAELVSNPVTIDTAEPNLRLLSLLGSNLALVSSPPQINLPNISQAPPFANWEDKGDALEWRVAAPLDWTYEIAELNSRTQTPIKVGDRVDLGTSGEMATYTSRTGSAIILLSVSVRNTIANGDFTAGLWAPVGDCNSVHQARAGTGLDAEVIPNGTPTGDPALRLSASLDSACEAQALDWRGGPVLLSLAARHLRGQAPRLCLWEFGPQRCASATPLTSSDVWRSYRIYVVPDQGTTALSLFVYADSGGEHTVDEYANISVRELRSSVDFAILATPRSTPSTPIQLFVLHNSYSTDWAATAGRHVLVDGMLNGWLLPSETVNVQTIYKPAAMVRLGQLISLAAAALIALVVGSHLLLQWRGSVNRSAGRRPGLGHR